MLVLVSAISAVRGKNPGKMNFAEILFLFALEPESGRIKPKLERHLDCALAGALLMNLALLNRVDTDLTCVRLDPKNESRDPLLLRVVDKASTGDSLLDKALQELQRKSGPRPTREWLEYFSQDGRDIRQMVVEHLFAKGILKVEETTRFFFFKTPCYRLLRTAEIEQFKTRLHELAVGKEVPDARDVVLVSLADACGLFERMFSAGELARVRPRIDALGKMDLIGQAVAGNIREIHSA